MATKHAKPTTVRKLRPFAIAALIALPLLAGCAQSASSRWAQNSAAIAPSKRPPALSVFSAIVDERDGQVQ